MAVSKIALTRRTLIGSITSMAHRDPKDQNDQFFSTFDQNDANLPTILLLAKSVIFYWITIHFLTHELVLLPFFLVHHFENKVL